MSVSKETWAATLREDWNNLTLRAVYADWLEEQSDPIEAARQRNWFIVQAREREKLDKLIELASPYDFDHDDGWNRTTVRGSMRHADDLLEAIDSENYFWSKGTSDTLADFINDGACPFTSIQDFWNSIEILRGPKFVEEKREGFYWGCSC